MNAVTHSGAATPRKQRHEQREHAEQDPDAEPIEIGARELGELGRDRGRAREPHRGVAHAEAREPDRESRSRSRSHSATAAGEFGAASRRSSKSAARPSRVT